MEGIFSTDLMIQSSLFMKICSLLLFVFAALVLIAELSPRPETEILFWGSTSWTIESFIIIFFQFHW